MKQAYVDVWDISEYIRVQMPTGEYGANSYIVAFSRVLSLGELMSFPKAQGRISWLGSDATLTQCAVVDRIANVACAFPIPSRWNILVPLPACPRPISFRYRSQNSSDSCASSSSEPKLVAVD